MYKFPLQEQFPELYRSDVSIYPSYTNFKLAYEIKCIHRYRESIAKYNDQFMKELLLIEKMQNKALEGVKVHREFTQNVLNRTIPKRGNMKNLCKIKLSPKDERRLQILLSED